MERKKASKKLVEALNDLWAYTGEMFEWSEDDKQLAKDGFVPSFDELKNSWMEIVKDTFNKSGLEIPQDKWMMTGGREGIHSEHLGHMLGDMQYLPRAYPNDKW